MRRHLIKAGAALLSATAAALLLILILHTAPTYGWFSANQTATVSGRLPGAEGNGFAVSLTACLYGEDGTGEDLFATDTVFPPLSPGDTYEFVLTLASDDGEPLAFEIFANEMTFTAADDVTADIFLIGVPQEAGEIAYLTEEWILEEDGFAYCPASLLSDTPLATVTAAQATVTFRLRLRTDLDALGLTAGDCTGASLQIDRLRVVGRAASLPVSATGAYGLQVCGRCRAPCRYIKDWSGRLQTAL